MLKVGYEIFLVPASISDQKIAGCITVLRELTPCNHYGKPTRENMQVSYECVRSLAAGATDDDEPEQFNPANLQKE
jgi:hypothetical protein